MIVNTTYKKLWHEAKEGLREKLMTLNAYTQGEKKKKSSDFQHKKLTKNEFNPRVTRRKKIVKSKNSVRGEKKTKSNSQLFKKKKKQKNKIDKALAGMFKKMREGTSRQYQE